jgi:hypothetical protein
MVVLHLYYALSSQQPSLVDFAVGDNGKDTLSSARYDRDGDQLMSADFSWKWNAGLITSLPWRLNHESNYSRT